MNINAIRVAEIKQYLWRFKSGRDYIKSRRMRKDCQEKKTLSNRISTNKKWKGSQIEKTSGTKTTLGKQWIPCLLECNSEIRLKVEWDPNKENGK